MAGKQPRRKHVPQRTCVVCRQATDKRRLTRLVRTPEGGVVVDPTGKLNGRGAYLCDQVACWDKALRHPGILGQALNSDLSAGELAAIAAQRPAAAAALPDS